MDICLNVYAIASLMEYRLFPAIHSRDWSAMTHISLLIGHLRSAPLFVVLGSEQRAERVSMLSGRLLYTWDGPRCLRHFSQELCVQSEEINFGPVLPQPKTSAGRFIHSKRQKVGQRVKVGTMYQLMQRRMWWWLSDIAMTQVRQTHSRS